MPPFFRGSAALEIAQAIGEHGPQNRAQINSVRGHGIVTRSALRWLLNRGLVECTYSLTPDGVAALDAMDTWEYDASLARKLERRA